MITSLYILNFNECNDNNVTSVYVYHGFLFFSLYWLFKLCYGYISSTITMLMIKEYIFIVLFISGSCHAVKEK